MGHADFNLAVRDQNLPCSFFQEVQFEEFKRYAPRTRAVENKKAPTVSTLSGLVPEFDLDSYRQPL